MLLLPGPLAGKLSVSRRIQVSGFFTLDNIIFNPANKKTDFQTGIGGVGHITLNTAVVDTSALYRILAGGLFQFQKCMKYLPRFMTFCTMLGLSRLVIQLLF